MSSVIESSSTSYLKKEYSTTETESRPTTGTINLQVTWNWTRVTSAAFDTTCVLLDEPYILKPSPLPFHKNSVQFGHMKTASRAVRRRSLPRKRCPNSGRPTRHCNISPNRPFLCKYHCGSKRKEGTYN